MMEKPMFLHEFIKTLDEKSQAAVVTALKMYEDEKDFYRRKCCGICGKILTEEEIKSVSSYNFIITCSKHRSHANKLQIHIVREELGIKEPYNLTSLHDLKDEYKDEMIKYFENATFREFRGQQLKEEYEENKVLLEQDYEERGERVYKFAIETFKDVGTIAVSRIGETRRISIRMKKEICKEEFEEFKDKLIEDKVIMDVCANRTFINGKNQIIVSV